MPLMRATETMETTEEPAVASHLGRSSALNPLTNAEDTNKITKLGHSDSGRGKSFPSTDLSEANIYHGQEYVSEVTGTSLDPCNLAMGENNTADENISENSSHVGEVTAKEQEQNQHKKYAAIESPSWLSADSGQGEDRHSVLRDNFRQQETRKTSGERPTSGTSTDADSGIERTPNQKQRIKFSFSHCSDPGAVLDDRQMVDPSQSRVREFVERQHRSSRVRYCQSVSLKSAPELYLKRRLSLPDLTRGDNLDMNDIDGGDICLKDILATSIKESSISGLLHAVELSQKRSRSVDVLASPDCASVHYPPLHGFRGAVTNLTLVPSTNFTPRTENETPRSADYDEMQVLYSKQVTATNSGEMLTGSDTVVTQQLSVSSSPFFSPHDNHVKSDNIGERTKTTESDESQSKCELVRDQGNNEHVESSGHEINAGAMSSTDCLNVEESGRTESVHIQSKHLAVSGESQRETPLYHEACTVGNGLMHKSQSFLEKSAEIKTNIEGPVSILKNAGIPGTARTVSDPDTKANEDNNVAASCDPNEQTTVRGDVAKKSSEAAPQAKSPVAPKIKRQDSVDFPSLDIHSFEKDQISEALLRKLAHTDSISIDRKNTAFSNHVSSGNDHSASADGNSAGDGNLDNRLEVKKSSIPETPTAFDSPSNKSKQMLNIPTLQQLPTPPLVSKSHFDNVVRELEKSRAEMHVQLQKMNELETSKQKLEENYVSALSQRDQQFQHLLKLYMQGRQQVAVFLRACETWKQKFSEKEKEVEQKELELQKLYQHYQNGKREEEILKTEIGQQKREYKTLSAKFENVEKSLRNERARFERDERHHKEKIAALKQDNEDLDQKCQFLDKECERLNSIINSRSFGHSSPYKEDSIEDLIQPRPDGSLDLVREPPSSLGEDDLTQPKAVYNCSAATTTSRASYRMQGARPKTKSQRLSVLETIVKTPILEEEEKCLHCYKKHSEFKSDAEFRSHIRRCES